jgi:integrase
VLTSAWHVDPVKILTRRELTAVLIDLGSRSARSANLRMNKVILRLACCCGLRVSEIAALRLCDVCVGAGRPHLRIGPKGAKGKKPRVVPLWWDAGTLEEIIAWKRERQEQGGRPDDAFVCCLWPKRHGQPLSRHTIRERFRSACKSLGLERLRTLTIHHGRHTFVSHALAGGRTLAEVRQAAGHASLITTSVYLHIAVDDDATPGNLFGVPPS